MQQRRLFYEPKSGQEEAGRHIKTEIERDLNQHVALNILSLSLESEAIQLRVAVENGHANFLFQHYHAVLRWFPKRARLRQSVSNFHEEIFWEMIRLIHSVTYFLLSLSHLW